MQLGLTPDTRRETDVHTFVEAAQRAGFSTLGIHSGLVGAQAHLPSPRRAWLPRAPRHRGERRRARHHGLGGTLGRRGRGDERAVGVDHVRGSLDRRHRCTRRAVRGDVCRGWLGHGDRVEPARALPTIKAALDMVAVAGVERAGLVIDSWNFAFSDDGWDDLAEVPLERIVYLQFADALAPRDDRPNGRGAQSPRPARRRRARTRAVHIHAAAMRIRRRGQRPGAERRVASTPVARLRPPRA